MRVFVIAIVAIFLSLAFTLRIGSAGKAACVYRQMLLSLQLARTGRVTNPDSSRTSSEPIVHRLFQILLATQVALGRQNRRMAKKKLDLLQFTSTHVTELRAASSKIMRCEVIQL
jgi:hypothetical protein